MNREDRRPGWGRALAGSALGVLLALAAPMMMMSELLSLMVVVLVPSIGVVLLYYWAGKGPALLSAVLQILFNALLFGGTFMWAAFFMTLVPVAVLIRSAQRPFFEQMRISIAAFGVGVLAAVLALYLSYGGNMIERVLMELPEAVRSLPQEALGTVMESVSAVLGESMTVETFYGVFDEMIERLVPYYQLNLPGLIFSGALVSAVLCTGISSWMRRRRGSAKPGTSVPLREWALPSSTTGGLLLICIVSYVLVLLKVRGAETVFSTAFSIAQTAFCIQALASFARRTYSLPVKRGIRVAIVAVVAVLCLSGGGSYVALYGCASAIFGSRGALRQKMNNNGNDTDRSGGAE